MNNLKLGFIGFGLIGGSIARSLKKKNPDITILVYTRRKNPDLEQGVQDRIIDRLLYEIDEQFSSCDIIFLCAPVLKNAEFLPVLKNIIKPECILTDVGSVKGTICRAAKETGLSQQFIGGHPMAGSEKTGFANSTDTLLENACYLLTPTEENRPEDVTLLQELVGLTGADCFLLSPEEHDRITAAISHVPHIIAVLLVQLVLNDSSEEYMKKFAAGGFKDMTRIASSSPAMWQDICIANKDSIDYFLCLLESRIEKFRERIAEGDKDAIYQAFQTAGEFRKTVK
jgi:prephenate dehydrogenase